MRTVIFGVDGLSFRVLHPLLKRGALPNFEKLRRDGSEAILKSKYPPLTPPAWTSLSTGLKPARHGVYDFWTYDEEQEGSTNRTAHIVTRRKGGKAIWNILSEYGKKVLVINVPTTYAPEAINGIMVSGYSTPNTDVEFTYPASFKEEIFRVVPNYQIDIDVDIRERLNIAGKVGPLTDAVLHMTEQHIKLIMYMMKEKPWDLTYLVFTGADRLQHQFWEEVCTFHPRTKEYYCMLDDALGQVLDMLEPEDCLFVVSDHGFCGHSSYFDINEYLYSKKLLFFKDPSIERDRRRVKQAIQFRRFVSRIGLRSLARKVKRKLKIAGLWTRTRFAPDGLERPIFDNIDWERTLAYVPSFSGFPGGFADIFLSPNITDEQIAELCDDLRHQVNPKNGKPLIDEIYTNEVYGTGPYTLQEPHLLLLPNKGMTFRLELGNESLWEDLDKSFGAHHKDGVLYAYGEPFKRNFKAPNAEIYDLVPTVLRTMNLPLPHAFDGKVLDELFIEKQFGELSPADENGLTRRKLQKLLEIQ